MSKFFSTLGENNFKEVKFKILVYPNITTDIKFLDKDSYVIVLKEIIKYINSMNKFIHWTVLSPIEIDYGDNTECVNLPLPSNKNSMRSHFNIDRIINVIDHRNQDFDIIYSHLPEHTLQLSNFIYNSTELRPKVIGYNHYVEFPYSKTRTMFLQNIIGMLEMEECGVNTLWFKNEIINEAKKYFNIQVIDKLEKIIQPHYLGTYIDNSSSNKPIITKSIFFNHRPQQYTGFNDFIKEMDKLWKIRQDFRVYIPYEIKESIPYVEIVKLPRNEYLDFPKQMHIGVAFPRENSGWAVAVTDGLSRGLPYLLPNSQFYPEKVGTDYPLFFNDNKDFINKINIILDNPNIKKDYNNLLQTISNKLLWNSVLPKWFNNWNIFNNFKTLREPTKAYDNIIELIRKNNFVDKNTLINKLRWGVQIDYSIYRNTLRNDPRIKLTKLGYQYVEQ